MVVKDFHIALRATLKNGYVTELSTPRYDTEFATREEFEAFVVKASKDIADALLWDENLVGMSKLKE